MIRGNQSISYYSTGNVIIWMLMAFQAGLINVGGLLGCHRFVSHLTGSFTLAGAAAREANALEFLSLLVVPAAFLIGSMISGLLVELRLRTDRQPQYYVIFGMLFAGLLTIALGGRQGWFGAFGESSLHARGYLLLALLSGICGMQNGTITTVSRAVVRTSHLTGITTDLGLGIVRYWQRHRLREPLPYEGRANMMRLGIIVYFTLGSLVGAYFFSHFDFAGFCLPALTSGGLFVAMLYFQVLKRG